MKVFQGTLVHSTWENPLEILEHKLIGVKDGKITFIEDEAKLDELRGDDVFEGSPITPLRPWEFLMPGLIDTHIHACQYAFAGTALDLPLMEWLKTYKYPAEARFADVVFAEEVYAKTVARVLRNGTTTACYFATSHLDSTLKLCDIVETCGQRAYIGNTCSDCQCPENNRETTQESVSSTAMFLKRVQARKSTLLTPVVTPANAISSTGELMTQLGQLAEEYQVPIQTHLSEAKASCEKLRGLFPEFKHYVDVYDKHNLMTKKTVLAHGVHLSDEELEVIKERNAGISHCPNSNIRWATGETSKGVELNRTQAETTAAQASMLLGGYHTSMLDALRYSVQVSNVLQIVKGADYRNIDYKEAFRLATLGGSQVLGISDQVGNFEVGKEFDALRITPEVTNSPFDLFSTDTVLDAVQKFLYLGDDRNITEVYVAGRRVL